MLTGPWQAWQGIWGNRGGSGGFAGWRVTDRSAVGTYLADQEHYLSLNAMIDDDAPDFGDVFSSLDLFSRHVILFFGLGQWEEQKWCTIST